MQLQLELYAAHFRDIRGFIGKRAERKDLMAESEGFEPPIDLRLCLISSQVHSTGLCQLSALFHFISGLRLAARAAVPSFVDLSW
jgi:hypothetical protein